MCVLFQVAKCKGKADSAAADRHDAWCLEKTSWQLVSGLKDQVMASGNPEASTVEERKWESILERTEQIFKHIECLNQT